MNHLGEHMARRICGNAHVNSPSSCTSSSTRHAEQIKIAPEIYDRPITMRGRDVPSRCDNRGQPTSSNRCSCLHVKKACTPTIDHHASVLQATHRVTFCTYSNSNFADERLQHGDPRVGTWASVSQANATGMHQRHAIRPLSSLPTACRALDCEGCMMRGRTLFIHRTVCFTSRLSHLAYVDHSWSFDPCLTEKGTAT